MSTSIDVSKDVEKAIGRAQGLAETAHHALAYATIWNDKPEMIRLLRLMRFELGKMADELLKATAQRDPAIPYEMDPDWIEDDQAYNEAIASATSTAGEDREAG